MDTTEQDSINYKKKIIPLITIGTILIIFIVTLLVLNLSRESDKTNSAKPSPTTPLSPLLNHTKQYEDPYGAFTFKYPQELHIIAASDGASLSIFDGKQPNIRLRLNVIVYPNPLDIDLETWAEQNKPEPDERINHTYEKTIFNTYQAVIIRSTYPCLGICDTIRESRDYDVLIKGRRYIILFSGERLTIAGTSKQDEELLKKVVQTVEIKNSRTFSSP